MFIHLFAHDGEDHSEEITETASWLSNDWLAAAVYLILLVFLYFSLNKWTSIKTPTILLLIMGINLFVGVFSFSYFPIVSVIAITVGMALALFFSIVAIIGSK